MKNSPPRWAQTLAIFIPLMAIVLAWLLNREPQRPDSGCLSHYRITGVAYYEDGKAPIPNAPVQVMDFTLGPSFTATDGSFIIERAPGKCHLQRLQLGVKNLISDEWVTRTIVPDWNAEQGEIDLGRVAFPLRQEKKNSKGGALPSPSVTTPHEQPPHIAEEKPAEKAREVRLIYPREASNPRVSVRPEPLSIEQGAISCLVKVRPGRYTAIISDGARSWQAAFSHDQGVVGGKQFYQVSEN